MIFSDRTNSIETSKTVEFTTIIRQLNQQGKNIIDLAVGEPQFNTQDAVLEATKKALDDQKTRYGPVLGLQELRIGIAKQFDGYDAQNILISNGSKQSLFLVFQALFNPGDEIIVPRPFWVSFTEQIKLAGAAPVLVDTNNHQLDVKAISDAITSKTKAIIINTPNNPTGAVYKKADIEAVIRLAKK